MAHREPKRPLAKGTPPRVPEKPSPQTSRHPEAPSPVTSRHSPYPDPTQLPPVSTLARARSTAEENRAKAEIEWNTRPPLQHSLDEVEQAIQQLPPLIASSTPPTNLEKYRETTQGEDSDNDPKGEDDQKSNSELEESVHEEKEENLFRKPTPPPSEPPSDDEDIMADNENNSSGFSASAKPDSFDGTKWSTWSVQMIMYLAANEAKIKTDQMQIMAVLSYMKGGDAGPWAAHISRAALFDEDGKLKKVRSFGTFEAFWEKCVARFGNKNEKDEAYNKFIKLRQGSKSADEYFQLADEYIPVAGLSGQDEIILRRVRVSINNDIAMELAKCDPELTKYDEYKNKATKIDRQLRAQRQAQQDERVHSAPHRPPPFQKKPDSQPIERKRDGTGATFGGHGEPMQLDEFKQRNLCFSCGKAGHRVKDCPEGKNRARQYVRQIRPAERALLADAITRLKESDFVDEYDADPVADSYPLRDDNADFSDAEH